MDRIPTKTRNRNNYEVTPLQKAQVCAAVVVGVGQGRVESLDAATLELRRMMGAQWTTQHAAQFLVGKAGLAAIQSTTDLAEVGALMAAREIARLALSELEQARQARQVRARLP